MRTHVSLLLLLAVVAPVPAADLKADAPGGKSSAAALVEQLGHPDFRTREAAGKKLLDLGERAMPAVAAGIDSSVPEVARRCEDLLAALKHKIDADALLAPTMVDLPEGEQTLQKAFEAITRQTHYWLMVNGDQSFLDGKIKLPGGKRPFWEAVDAVCAAAKLEVAEVVVSAEPAGIRPGSVEKPLLGRVRLQAASGQKRTVVHQALLIRVEEASKDVLAGYRFDVCPLVVRVFPEPKLRWQRITDVAVVKAEAKDGTELRPALRLAPVRDPRMEEMLLSSRPVRHEPPSGFTEAATRGMLLLAAEPTASEFKTVSAVVRFTAWTEPAEVAVVKLKAGDAEGVADGPHATRLKVKVIGPIANQPGSTTVEMTHRWDPERVRPDSTTKPGDEVWLENSKGRATLVHANDHGARGPNRWGIAATDVTGESLLMAASGTRIDAEVVNGRALNTLSAKYVVRKDKSDDGKLAAVAFHASRVVEVGVPFTVKGLPLATGTSSGEAQPRMKR